MTRPEVLVIRTGVANIASVLTGLRRVGAAPRIADHCAEVAAASHVVLPGVGAFGAGMKKLKERGLDAAIRERITKDRPTLAVCLGLQLLCAGSEEDPSTEGLGIIPDTVRRFPEDVRVPQFGWNQVRPVIGCDYLTEGFAYFANSYRLADSPAGWRAAFTVYGSPFVSALELGSVLACQFHPELSGHWGQELLARWLEDRRMTESVTMRGDLN